MNKKLKHFILMNGESINKNIKTFFLCFFKKVSRWIVDWKEHNIQHISEKCSTKSSSLTREMLWFSEVKRVLHCYIFTPQKHQQHNTERSDQSRRIHPPPSMQNHPQIRFLTILSLTSNGKSFNHHHPWTPWLADPIKKPSDIFFCSSYIHLFPHIKKLHPFIWSITT